MRRFEARARAHRRSRLRRAAAVVLVLALVAGAWWAVGASPLLGLREVRVEGVEAVAGAPAGSEAARDQLVADVRARVGVASGTPLVRVDTDAVAARVATLPRVAAVRVRRELPGRLVVSVRPRVAAAVVPVSGGFRVVDAQGVTFASVRRRPAGVPLVSAPENAAPQALRAALEVIAALPAQLRTRVATVATSGPRAVVLRLVDGRQVVWGSSAESPRKARVLVALLTTRARTYDVSAPDMPTTR